MVLVRFMFSGICSQDRKGSNQHGVKHEPVGFPYIRYKEKHSIYVKSTHQGIKTETYCMFGKLYLAPGVFKAGKMNVSLMQTSL